ncbi:aldehyde dehydrogenase [Rhodospirillum sp. A1_3_36]|uniref:aldehyde dehydrogenase n=1 Tax=Rhodospirillum sp. A1_3_36 TaxID=3391666 RepID=UPI0039A65B96
MNGTETLGGPPQKRAADSPEDVLKTGLFVKGVHHDAADGATFERLDPSTGVVSSIAADGRAADAEQMVSVAAARFSAWSGRDGSERAAVLRRAKTLFPRYAARFHTSMLGEIGATTEWVEFNLRVASDVLEATAQLAEQFGRSKLQQAEEPSQAVRVPAGVCLAIAPWNAPLALGMRAIAFPLAFGNTVIFKASELCPVTHVLLGELLHEAGLPAGVLSILTNAPENSREVVETLIACAPVRRVNFTGSTRVGRIVAGIAASRLKRCLLELGGKSPLIVLPDADIGKAVEAALFGAYLNSGQICMATDRIIIDHAIADAFVSALAERASALTAGDPRNPGVRIGPLATSSIAVRLSALIEDAVSKGGVLRSGGPSRGQFMDATVIDHVSPMMKIYSEECFGPLVGIYRVGSVEEAVTIANDCEYGLSSAVFGGDLSLARAVVDQLETGICHINSATVADDPFMPFGGVKSSGYGRFGGPSCLDEFTELRWITANRFPKET